MLFADSVLIVVVVPMRRCMCNSHWCSFGVPAALVHAHAEHGLSSFVGSCSFCGFVCIGGLVAAVLRGMVLAVVVRPGTRQHSQPFAAVERC